MNFLLKVHSCRFENLPICLCSYKNNNLKISHYQSKEFSGYLPVKSLNFLKSRLIFNIFYCFWVFVNSVNNISLTHISKSKRGFDVKFSAYYFNTKTKILVDFQICISAPLTIKISYFSFFTYVKISRSTTTWKKNSPTLTSFSVLPFLPLLQLLECLNGYMCGHNLTMKFPLDFHNYTGLNGLVNSS